MRIDEWLQALMDSDRDVLCRRHEALKKVDVMIEGTGCEILFDSDPLNEEN